MPKELDYMISIQTKRSFLGLGEGEAISMGQLLAFYQACGEDVYTIADNFTVTIQSYIESRSHD